MNNISSKTQNKENSKESDKSIEKETKEKKIKKTLEYYKLPYDRFLTYFSIWILSYVILEAFIFDEAGKFIEQLFFKDYVRFFVLLVNTITIVVFLVWMKSKGEGRIRSSIDYLKKRGKKKKTQAFKEDSKKISPSIYGIILVLGLYLVFTVLTPIFPDSESTWKDYNFKTNFINYISKIVLTTQNETWKWILLVILYFVSIGFLLYILLDLSINLTEYFDGIKTITKEFEPVLEVLHEDNYMGFKNITSVNNALLITAIFVMTTSSIGTFLVTKDANYMTPEMFITIIYAVFAFILGIFVYSGQRTVHNLMKNSKEKILNKIRSEITKDIKKHGKALKDSQKKTESDKYFKRMSVNLTLRDQLMKVHDRPLTASLVYFIITQFMALAIALIIWTIDTYAISQ